MVHKICIFPKHLYSQPTIFNLISQHLSINPFPSSLLVPTLPSTLQQKHTSTSFVLRLQIPPSRQNVNLHTIAFGLDYVTCFNQKMFQCITSELKHGKFPEVLLSSHLKPQEKYTPHIFAFSAQVPQQRYMEKI